MGNPEWVNGKFGNALELDGASSYVDCGNDESLNIPTGDPVTMCAWVNSKVGSIAAWKGILAKREGASYSYGINFRTGAFQIYTSGVSGIQGFACDLPANQWVFVCGIMSAEPTELYIDGELFGGAAKGPGGGVSAVAANRLRIGASLSAGEIFDGIIDEVAVFNVALSEDDINDIMTRGLGVTTGITAVEPLGKLGTTWAAIKAQ